MAKKFSLISVGEVQVVKSGYIEPDSLPEIEELIELAQNTYTYEEIKVVIFHLLFLDYEGAETTDATEKEVEVLQDNLPELYDYGCIVIENEIEIKGLYGVKEDEIVEKFM